MMIVVQVAVFKILSLLKIIKVKIFKMITLTILSDDRNIVNIPLQPTRSILKQLRGIRSANEYWHKYLYNNREIVEADTIKSLNLKNFNVIVGIGDNSSQLKNHLTDCGYNINLFTYSSDGNMASVEF